MTLCHRNRFCSPADGWIKADCTHLYMYNFKSQFDNNLMKQRGEKGFDQFVKGILYDKEKPILKSKASQPAEPIPAKAMTDADLINML